MKSFWLNCLPFPHPTALFGDENNVDESKFDIPAENEIMKSMSGENDGSAVLSLIRSIEAISVAEKSSTPLPPWKCKGAKKTAVGNNLDVVISGPPAPAEDRDDNLTVLSSMTTLAAFSLLFTYTCLALFPLPRVQIWGSNSFSLSSKLSFYPLRRLEIDGVECWHNTTSFTTKMHHSQFPRKLVRTNHHRSLQH